MPPGRLAGPTPRRDRPVRDTNHVLFHATCSNRTLLRISTIDQCRFDPRATVHPSGLYNQTPDPLHIQSIIIIARGVPQKDNLRAPPNLGHS
jgi:hypothetical protein